MPEGPDGKTIIIVKKVSGHGGHHGGAWKVAYADFVTAMMALFMVLWLVNSAAEPTRQRIASYFRKPGIFQKGSGTPIEVGGGGILPDVFSPSSDGNSQVQTTDRIYKVDASTGKVKELYDEGQGNKEFQYAPQLDGGKDLGTTGEHNVLKAASGSGETEIEEKKLEELKTEIEKMLSGAENAEKIEGILGDVEIKIDQRGLVLEIMDTDKTSMFQVGQALVQDEAEKKLIEIGTLLSKVSNPIDIEGHTDSRPFRSKSPTAYDNWSLSSDRANAARKILEKSGFKKGQIARVVGYADERPRDTENPLNPANRRITISMRYSDRAKAALEGTNMFETNSNKPKPKKVQEDNKIIDSKEPVIEVNKDKPKESSDFKQADHEVSAPVKSESSTKEVLENEKLTESGLKIEVSTVTPEGAVVTNTRDPIDEEKKELIFGGKNTFFKK